jgi:hypothetical protein
MTRDEMVSAKADKEMNPKAEAENPSPQPASPVLRLPLEIRNMIYELLINSSIITRPIDLTFDYKTRLYDNPWINTHQFDLSITTAKVKFQNLRLPSNMLYANHQTYNEMNTLIYSKVQHLKLTGDFLLGLAPTEAIFRLLERRPWIHASTKSVTIVLKFSHIVPLNGGVAINAAVAEKYPWLCSRLQIAELNVQKFDMHNGLMLPKPQSWIRRYLFRKLGVGKRTLDGIVGWLHPALKPMSNEHNTLPDLARLFEQFPLLEKIDIQTDHCILLSLFPAPKETASTFLPLHIRGVEVNVLLHNWQVSQFCSMLYRNGVEKGNIGFASQGQEMINLSYERLVGGELPAERIVTYRFLDCIVPEKTLGKIDASVELIVT